MNTGLLSRLHPRKSSFVLSWSAGASLLQHRQWKCWIQRKLLNRTSQTSLPQGRKQNFSNRDKFGIKTRQIQRRFWIQNNCLFRKTPVPAACWEIALLVSLIFRKSLEFFCKQTRIGIVTRNVRVNTDFNIFLIALKHDYINAQYV